MILMGLGIALSCWAAVAIMCGFEWIASWLAGTGLMFSGVAWIAGEILERVEGKSHGPTS